VIDDDPALLDIAKEWLEGEIGFDVTTAKSAEEGLSLLRTRRLDAVISDYQMPTMDGLELLRAIRDGGSRIPFILFTGKGREEVAMDALEAGADGYQQKGQQSRPQFATLAQKVVMAVGRARAEEALRASERRYRSLFENEQDAVLLTIPDGRVISANPAMCRMLDMTEEEVIRIGRRGIVVDDAALRRALQEREGTGRTHAELTYRRRDGSTFIGETSSCVFSNEEGEIRTSTIIRDITERKQMELKLARTRDLMQYIISHARSAIAVLDRDMRYVYVSDRYLSEYHLVEDVIGKCHYDVFPDLPQRWKVVHQQVLAGAVKSEEDDPFVRADGRIEWTRWECRPWFSEDGTIGGLILYTEVINDRKEAEEALRTSERRWRGVVNASPDGIVIISLDGHIQEMSTSAMDLYGFKDKEEIIGRDMYDFLDPTYRDKATLLLGELLRGHHTGPSDYRVFRADGSPLDLEINAEVLREVDGTPRSIIFVERDVTRRKLMEEALLQTNKRLTLMNSVTRHDTLNQVMAIKGYAELLQKRDPSPQQLEYINSIKRNAVTIEKQMAFTRAYQEIGVQAPRWMEMGACLAKISETLPPGVLRTRVETDRSIWTDPMFERVVHNLIDNAMRHGGATHIDVTSGVAEGCLLLSFKDDGKGISELEREHLFERGYGKNMGFGLFLCKEILSITNISIHEEPSSTGGACFVLRVPPGGWR
jgi:PAS domain S-box-containing protein